MIFEFSLSSLFLLLHVLRQKQGEIPNSLVNNLKIGIRTRSDRVDGCFLLHSPTPRKRQFYIRASSLFCILLYSYSPISGLKFRKNMKKLIFLCATPRGFPHLPLLLGEIINPLRLCNKKKRPGSAHESYREHSSWPSSSSVDDYVAIS